MSFGELLSSWMVDDMKKINPAMGLPVRICDGNSAVHAGGEWSSTDYM